MSTLFPEAVPKACHFCPEFKMVDRFIHLASAVLEQNQLWFGQTWDFSVNRQNSFNWRRAGIILEKRGMYKTVFEYFPWQLFGNTNSFVNFCQNWYFATLWSKYCKNCKSSVTWLHWKADSKYRIQTYKRSRSHKSIKTCKRFKSLVRFWPDACGPEASKRARIIGFGSGRTPNTGLMWTTLSGYTALVNDPCPNDQTYIYMLVSLLEMSRGGAVWWTRL